MMANSQSSLAISTPVPARDKPISMMTGPITTREQPFDDGDALPFDKALIRK